MQKIILLNNQINRKMDKNRSLKEISTKDMSVVIGEMTPQLQDTGRKIGGLLSNMIDGIIDAMFNPKTRQI